MVNELRNESGPAGVGPRVGEDARGVSPGADSEISRRVAADLSLLDGAEPGILMMAYPRQGVSHPQEIAPDVAEDMVKYLRFNASVSVPYGDFEKSCLVTKEWNKLEPGSVEQKLYEPGLGLVLVKELAGGKTVYLELIDILIDP